MSIHLLIIRLSVLLLLVCILTDCKKKEKSIDGRLAVVPESYIINLHDTIGEIPGNGFAIDLDGNGKTDVLFKYSTTYSSNKSVSSFMISASDNAEIHAQKVAASQICPSGGSSATTSTLSTDAARIYKSGEIVSTSDSHSKALAVTYYQGPGSTGTGCQLSYNVLIDGVQFAGVRKLIDGRTNLAWVQFKNRPDGRLQFISCTRFVPTDALLAADK
jgi:hypothetical protein